MTVFLFSGNHVLKLRASILHPQPTFESHPNSRFMKIYHTIEEIEKLVHEFESRTLPRAQWTHAAHLTMALFYLKNNPAPEATERIRSGIQRLNDAHGVKMTTENGYHETITLFYIGAVRKYLDGADSNRSIVELANGLLGSRYAEKDFPFEYYSRERLMSWEARIGWLEPDLKKLT